MSKKYDKTTKELSEMLGKVGKEAALEEYIGALKKGELKLGDYLKEILFEKKLEQSDVIKQSGLAATYAYQIFSGRKENPGKSKLLCICIASRMNFAETQRALEIAGCGVLYPRDPADAIVIYNLNKENWSVIDINLQLAEHDINPLE